MTSPIMQSAMRCTGSRSHDAVIRVYDDAGNVIATHEQSANSKNGGSSLRSLSASPWRLKKSGSHPVMHEPDDRPKCSQAMRCVMLCLFEAWLAQHGKYTRLNFVATFFCIAREFKNHCGCYCACRPEQILSRIKVGRSPRKVEMTAPSVAKRSHELGSRNI